MQTFPLFQFLRWLLVVVTGRGYDRSGWINTLHHKLAYRLHRKLSWFGISGIQRVPAPGMPGKYLYVPAEDGGVGHQLIMYREYEPFESSLVRKNIKPGMTVYNVGANIGYYSLLASECVGEHGSVLAFEPEPNNFELLKRNIRENRIVNVQLFPKAVGAEVGVAQLSISASNFGDHQLRHVAGRNSVEVSVTTLDELTHEHSEPDSIIMDVQGSELDVFRGAEKTLAMSRLKIIFMEFWPQGLNERKENGAKELLHLLESNGFSFSIIDETNRALRAISPKELLHSVAGPSEVNLFCTR